VTPADQLPPDAEDALDAAAGELYALEPGEFVAARDAKVRAARAAGDRALATAIGKLRRPTASAWAVNLLARDRPDRLAELVELGSELRAAQERLAGADLRRLSEQRRAVVAELAGAAAGLATERGNPPSDAARREIEATLDAALADADAGDAVRSARLTVALSYAGMGSVDLTGAVATPSRSRPAAAPADRAAEKQPAKRGAATKDGAAKDGAAKDGAAKDRAAKDRRDRRLAAAADAERAARDAATAAEDEAGARASAAAAAHDRHEAARGRLAAAQRELAAARDEEAAAAQALRAARHAAEVADRAAAAARQRLSTASATVDKLRTDG
jgi:hypothetical protein